MDIKYLKLKEAAEILSVSSRTLANMAVAGKITAYRLPSATNAKPRYRFKQQDIEEFMNGNKLMAINVNTKNAFKNNKNWKAKIDVQRIKKYINTQI